MTLKDKYREICADTVDYLNDMLRRDNFEELEDYLETGIVKIHIWEKEYKK